jgi:hypothetical protein
MTTITKATIHQPKKPAAKAAKSASDAPRGAPIQNQWGMTPGTALRWAYAHEIPSTAVVDPSAGVRGTPGGDSLGLTRQESSAQAALIRRVLDRLPALEHAWCEAVYLPAPSVERQAGGGTEITDRFGVPRGKAIRAVAHWLAQEARLGSARPLRGFEEAVAQYVLGVANQDRLAAALKLRRDRAAETGALLDGLLRHLHKRAMRELGLELRKEGLL